MASFEKPMTAEQIEELFQSTCKLKDSEPEFNNFLNRIDEVSNIISGLSSENPLELERAMRKADLLLLGKQQPEVNGKSKVTSERTIINKPKEPKEPEQMTQEGFMQSVEKDAKERYEDRQMRKAKSDLYKKNGNLCFHNKEYTDALDNYNKAISLIKDSPCLYTNRALCFIRLEIFSKAIEDCDKALLFSESSLRAHLFKAKALYSSGDIKLFDKCIEEAKEKTGNEHNKSIDDYVKREIKPKDE